MQEFELHFEGPLQQRLDRFLAQRLPQFSRSRLQSLVRQGFVLIDGTTAHKAGLMIAPGSLVVVHVPERIPSALQAEEIDLDIIYEDRDVIVLNKPSGMVVHPGVGHEGGTLANAVLAHDPRLEGVGGAQRPGVVHRLDKGTSGLIMLAKNDAAMHWLQEEFEMRRVRKVYLALVDGCPPTPSGRIEAPIGRDAQRRQRMSIVAPAKGRHAVTEYSTMEHFAQHTLLQLHPITGRTHQIRVHCTFIGCPITGDTVYGRKKASVEIARPFLHAQKLGVRLPFQTNTTEFTAPLPIELQRVLEALRTEPSAGLKRSD